MSVPDSTAPDRPPPTPRRPRVASAAVLAAFHGPDRPSQRACARDHDVPRSTVQHWLRRHRRLDLDPRAARFFDSPAGVAFLHRLVVALHLVFPLQGCAGLRLLTLFLRLAQRDRLVAASHGARHQYAALVEQAVGDFADVQRPRLAAGMPARAIAVAEDETLHPATCLVAIEPVSGFVLVEQYAERRDAATWDAAVGQALAGLAQAWPWAERLVAGMYLRQAAAKANGADRRRQLRALADACLAEARAKGAEPPGGWPAAEALAAEWAGWFQRSSSCVEGRNGQLPLRHHSLHRLSRRKLRALTALHNYWVRRADGTTAAERFFGTKPADLFEWLLERLPLPARPARRRLRAA